MRKYNTELLRQLLDERWHTKGVSIPVYEELRPCMGMPYNILASKHITNKDPLDYIVLVDSLIDELHRNLSRSFAKFSDSVSLFAHTEGTSYIENGKIITPNKYITGEFKPYDDGRYWKGAHAIIRVKVVNNYRMKLFAPYEPLVVSGTAT